MYGIPQIVSIYLLTFVRFDYLWNPMYTLISGYLLSRVSGLTFLLNILSELIMYTVQNSMVGLSISIFSPKYLSNSLTGLIMYGILWIAYLNLYFCLPINGFVRIDHVWSSNERLSLFTFYLPVKFLGQSTYLHIFYLPVTFPGQSIYIFVYIPVKQFVSIDHVWNSMDSGGVTKILDNPCS